jgi:hypothetical protein
MSSCSRLDTPLESLMVVERSPSPSRGELPLGPPAMVTQGFNDTTTFVHHSVKVGGSIGANVNFLKGLRSRTKLMAATCNGRARCGDADCGLVIRHQHQNTRRPSETRRGLSTVFVQGLWACFFSSYLATRRSFSKQILLTYLRLYARLLICLLSHARFTDLSTVAPPH